MAFQDLVYRLIPEGSGDVLWLGSRHAQALIDGLPVSAEPKRAIVLEGLLGQFKDPTLLLRQLADRLDDEGLIIAVTAARMNPAIRTGFTRAEVLRLFDAAGYDVVRCELIRDPAARHPRLAVDGKNDDQHVSDIEERTSSGLVVAARVATAEAPPCTIVTLGDGGPPTAGLSIDVELIRADIRPGETRALAWNRGALAATGKYLAFMEGVAVADGPWLGPLLSVLRSNPKVGAAGTTAFGFGPVRIPAHQLPYPIDRAVAGKVPAVGGAGMALPRRLFVESGAFDERLSADLDGPDLCLRLRARGLEIHHVPELAVVDERAALPTERSRASRFFLSTWSGQIPVEPEQPPGADPHADRAAPAPVLWSAPLLQRSGYGEEARAFIAGLDQAGVAVLANPNDWNADTSLPRRQLSRLMTLTIDAAPDRFINVVHSFPAARMLLGGSQVRLPMVEHFVPHPKAVLNVGRTMYETDRIPEFWAHYCNQMDEVWVPSRFNVDTFTKSGVQKQKLKVVPGAVDTELYAPGVPPMYVPGAEGFVFLSVFVWSLRKGWDALVRAYLEEFSRDEPVTLVMKVMRHWNKTPNAQAAELNNFIRRVLGRDPSGGPRIVILRQDLHEMVMPRLYGAANAFVLASRGEAYGRPFLEAMAMGLPTIGTRCGGNVDFMDESNSYLVPTHYVDVPNDVGAREVPDYAGHRWAEPDVEALKRSMRTVFENRDEAQARANRGRQDVLRGHSLAVVAQAVTDRLRDAGVQPLASRRAVSAAVTWEGPHTISFGMAEVNREMVRALSRSPAVDVKLSEARDTRPWLTGRPADVTVRHRWPPDFDPPDGRWVTYQPWEYGSIPAAWVEPLNRMVDEVWVPSTYVRDSFLSSGVDPAKVAVVPYGIDPDRFHMGVAPIEVPTGKSFRFLFVGGTIHRKGADVLLDTYLATFRREDDVCLVIKDLGSSSFYRGQGLGDRIRKLQADRTQPELVYLDQDLADSDMPGLYAACQCLVHPYRGEGFGLPIAEAMASGLPVIVPRHGACLDFCDDTVAYMVKATEMRGAKARVGGIVTVEPGWWGEVDRDDLARAMELVFNRRDEAAAVGRRASERIRSDFSWSRAAGVAVARITALAERRPRISACLIVKDEERVLRRCLMSLEGLVDEIIVVDTGSTDHTVELASGLGAKVYPFAWTGDFSAARNESLRRATGNWILVVDADEWLDSDARREIRMIVDGETGAAYALRLVTAKRNLPELERRPARLFTNRPGVRFEGKVGERLVTDSGMGVDAEPTGVVVHHDGTAAGRKRRAARLIEALEQQAHDLRDDAGVAVGLGLAYLDAGRASEAEHEAARALHILHWRPQGDEGRRLKIVAEWLQARAKVPRPGRSKA